jgi:hypothetical protein
MLAWRVWVANRVGFVQVPVTLSWPHKGHHQHSLSSFGMVRVALDGAWAFWRLAEVGLPYGQALHGGQDKCKYLGSSRHVCLVR